MVGRIILLIVAIALIVWGIVADGGWTQAIAGIILIVIGAVLGDRAIKKRSQQEYQDLKRRHREQVPPAPRPSQLKPPEALRPLDYDAVVSAMERLSSPILEERIKARDELSAAVDPQGESSDSWWTILSKREATRRGGKSSYGRLLVTAMLVPDYDIRHAAAEDVRKLLDPARDLSADETARYALAIGDREWAGSLGPDSAEALLFALHSPDDLLRNDAVHALAGLSEACAKGGGGLGELRSRIPAEILEVSPGLFFSGMLRSSALDIMQSCAYAPAVGAVADVLEHDGQYASRAARTLFAIDSPDAALPIIANLPDLHERVLPDALDKLKEWTGQDFGDDLDAWQEWGSTQQGAPEA